MIRFPEPHVALSAEDLASWSPRKHVPGLPRSQRLLRLPSQRIGERGCRSTPKRDQDAPRSPSVQPMHELWEVGLALPVLTEHARQGPVQRLLDAIPPLRGHPRWLVQHRPC